MRYLTLLLFVFSFFSLNAQDCPPGDVTITCQTEMDAFEAQYPNCVQINGNLTLADDGTIDCNSVFPDLPALKSIAGNLNIYTASNADGLPNLKSVESINVNNEFGGTFAVLDSVPGSILLINSYQGVSFPTCPQLKYIGGALGINTSEGGELDSHDFPALEYVGGNLYDYSNWTDSDFSGFTSLRYVGGNLDIEEGEIDYFNALDTIGGDLILRNYEFDFSIVNIDITGMNQLKYIGGNFRLNGDPGNRQCVRGLSGLSQLNYIGGNFEYYWQYDGTDGCSDALTDIDGLQQLRYVGGTLRIGETDLFNLDFLTQLESIGGNLEIRGNDLQSIEGLNHAIAIGGELIVENNFNLSECAVQAVCDHINSNGVTTIANNMAGCGSVGEVEALCPTGECLPDGITFSSQVEIDSFSINYPGCFDIQGTVIIEETVPGDITNLDALASITITGGLVIQNNTNLSQCAITSICSYFQLGGTATINNNTTGCNTAEEIIDVCDFQVCPAGDVVLRNQQEIIEYSIAYPQCTEIAGNLNIGDGALNDINDLNLLSNIESVQGNVSISMCNNLPDITALSNLHTIGGDIVIEQNAMLTNLHGLHNISNFSGDCTVYDNDALTSFSNLGIRKSNRFTIEENDALIDLNGLEQLDTVIFVLEIQHNDNLTTLEGLQLRSVRSIYVEDNQSLTSLQGFNNLEDVYQFFIRRNNVLPDLGGLEGLRSISYILNIRENNSLVNLEGLNNLESVSFRFWIKLNPVLNNIEALTKLDSIGSDLYIQENQALSQCATLGICSYLGNGGSAIIENNLTGCNNVEEVETSCGALPIEMTDPLRVRLKDKTAILQWRTATEINNSGFEIQRSKDGIQWEKIGWQSGQGDTSTPHSYTYTDPNPLFGTSYYRLKQVDTNGDLEYSNIVSLQYIRNGVTVYPNPVKERLYFHTNHSFVQKITIYNTVGSQVAEIINPGIDIDVSTLPKGIYILKITIDDEDFYEKIIVE